MKPAVIEQIPTQDWEATPDSVRKVLLSLEHERNAILEQLERLEHAQDTTSEKHKRRIERYHFLVEQQFLKGLTPGEQQEIEQLGAEIDGVNAAFYPSLESLAETIAAQTGKQPR